MEEEHKTYQPKWEERKAEGDSYHHHHHHHHTNYSNLNPQDWGGWLKFRDKHAYYGLIVLVVTCIALGAYKIFDMYRAEIQAMPKGDFEVTVDPLWVDIVLEERRRVRADSIAQNIKNDSMIRSVRGEHFNVYRPPRQNDNEMIDEREWQIIKRNIHRWFQSNGRDWKFILGVSAFGIFILSLAGYGIYKHNHPHGRE